jgi:hypothetical protein
MRIHSVMFGSATDPLSLPSLTIRREAATSFAVGVGLPRSGRYVARFVEIIVFAILLALMALPVPARAQTFTISSVTASPVTVQPGQTVTFSATITASQNASNYPVEFSLIFNGQNVTQKVFYLTFQAGATSIQAYSWTVPAGTGAGTYSMEVAVFNPAWSSMLAMKSAALTIAGATTGGAAAGATTYPVLLEFPVVSGAAQVGDVLTSTTGTWTGATSFAYQWSGNKAWIAGATAATYIPVSSDSGHTLTSTVVATGSPGAKSSATSAATVPIATASTSSPAGSASGSTSFVPLHTYYISPTGSDSNSGTASSPWATPNHAVVCGDVIVAAAGTYTSQFGIAEWGKVSNCPSTSGGIDGTGGIYFAVLLCAGPKITGCTVGSTSYASEPFRVGMSNWAIEGFSASMSPTVTGDCYHGTADYGVATHHLAFINDIASNCGDAGFGTSFYGSVGLDQSAVVGAISYNGTPSQSNGGICGSGVSMIPANGTDTSAGTHVFVAGYFGWKNINALTGAGCNTDGEGIVFDSWSCPPSGGTAYKYQGVAEQNVVWGNGGPGFEVYPNCTANGDLTQVIVFSNTSYGNLQDPKHGTGSGEFLLGSVGPSGTALYSAFNNIFVATNPADFANATWCNNSTNPAVADCNSTFIKVSANYFWNSSPGTVNVAGNPNTDTYINGVHNATTYPFGTNTYSTPGFASAGSLPAGAPNCAAYGNVEACMNDPAGYNVYGHVTPSGGAVGYGYRAPGPCAVDAYYPTWLKGIVYLQWNGSALTENSGLITKPCNM